MRVLRLVWGCEASFSSLISAAAAAAVLGVYQQWWWWQQQQQQRHWGYVGVGWLVDWSVGSPLDEEKETQNEKTKGAASPKASTLSLLPNSSRSQQSMGRANRKGKERGRCLGIRWGL